MIICPVCSFRNPDANDRCFRCSAVLKRDARMVAEAFDKADKKGRKFARRRLFEAPLERITSHPLFTRLNQVPDDGRYRYPYTAGLLSMVMPGAGHWYAGQPHKGLLLFAGAIIFIVAALVTIHGSWSNQLLVLMLIYWIVSWASSVAAAARANGQAIGRRYVWALVFGGALILGVSISVLQYLSLGFFSIEKITTSDMLPTFVKNDRVVYSSVPYWFRSPRVGEIVSFDPPRFVAEAGNDIYSINIKRYYQRVVAGPGDRVEKRGTIMTRNGRQLLPSELPFNGTGLPDFSATVPAGHYFIPVTDIPEDVLSGMLGGKNVPYVGEGYTFPKWPEFAMIKESEILALGIAVVDKPERRRWL